MSIFLSMRNLSNLSHWTIGGSKTNLRDVLWECNRLVPRVTTLQL